MRKNKPLTAKAALKAKKPLRASVKPKKQTKPTITKLRKKADNLFSKYIRLRDSEYKEVDSVYGWYGKCVTCSYKKLVAYIDDDGKLRFTRGWDAGHLVSRGNLFLRYDEENVNLQDSFRCNRMRSGEIAKYRVEVDKKYGEGTAQKLEMLAAVNRHHHLKRKDLEQIIQDCTEAIKFYEAQPMR